MPVQDGVLLAVRAWLSIGLTILLTGFASGPLGAEEPEFYERPFAQDQWNIGRRLDESQLRYCVDRRDPDWDVAAAIADAIASALLLEPQRHVVESDLLQPDITKIYEVMLKHCDMHMGFRLLPGGYGNWVTLTRAYYDASYVFVTRDPDLGALSDVAPNRPIGATLGTVAHMRLVSYLGALPREDRWPTFPMGTSDRAIDALRDGTVDVALVWAPTLWARQRENPDLSDMRVIAPDPLPTSTLGVGALLLSDETFLRAAVDEAVAALRSDGTIEGILGEFDFPATAGPDG